MTRRAHQPRIVVPSTAAAMLGLVAAAVVAAAPAPASAATVAPAVRVSVPTTSGQGNALSDFPSISADGRWVAFQSQATNLDPADTDVFWDVYLKDTQTGVLTLVSTTLGGAGKGNSTEPVISGDGSHVVFTSRSSNLVPGDTNGIEDVFRWSRATGTIERVSTQDTTNAEANAFSGDPDVNADGRYVAFESDATNLQALPDGNPPSDVFVKDMLTGSVQKASVATGGTTAGGFHIDASISDDGRTVAFSSNSPFLVPGDTNSRFDVFVHALDTVTTTRVSVTSAGVQAANCSANPNTGSLDPDISGNGQVVAFISVCTDLVPDDTTGFTDVFSHDRATGETRRESIDDGGYVADPATGDSLDPSISADGRFIAFRSLANDLDFLVSGGAGSEVFVRDRETRSVTAVAPPALGLVPSINADGTRVAFSSTTPIVSGDTNAVADVHTVDITPDAIYPLYVLPQQQRPEVVALMASLAAEIPELALVTYDAGAGTYTFPGCPSPSPRLPQQPFDYQAALSGGPYVDLAGLAAPAIDRRCRVDAMTYLVN